MKGETILKTIAGYAGILLIYRKEVPQEVIVYETEDYVMLSTSCIVGKIECRKYYVERDATILQPTIGISKEAINKILGKTALRFLG